MAKRGDVDTLEKTISFLQKREGIDKTLKIIRYTSRLVAAVSPPGSDTQRRFDALQSSVGTSRKAYRLGKFLQDVQALRKVKDSGWVGALEVVAYAGEGVYYFLDQFLWLMKTGAISKESEKRIAKVTAWAEAAGYAANITLNLRRIAAMRKQEAALHRALAAQRVANAQRLQQQRQEMLQQQQEGEEGGQEQQQERVLQGGSGSAAAGLHARASRQLPGAAAGGAAGAGAAAGGAAGALAGRGAEEANVCRAEGEAELLRQLALVRYNRLLRSAFVVQDLADALMALSDITDARYKPISHPVVLSLAGLLSAAVSTYKYWQAA